MRSILGTNIKVDKNFLVDYLNGHSPVGMEAHLPHDPVSNQQRWINQIQPFVDKVYSDAYGNVWAIQNPKGKYKVAIMSHADEIGWRIKNIDEKGYMTMIRNGGSDNRVSPGTRGWIHAAEKIPVTFPFPAIHLEKHLDSPQQFSTTSELVYAYAGLDKKELLEKGVDVGGIITHEGIFKQVGNFYTGRGLDNRIGGVVIIEVARIMKSLKKDPSLSIIYLNTVQEEVGLKGAGMWAHKHGSTLDAAICIDVCHGTNGYPMVVSMPVHGDIALGKGPVITSAPAVHPKLRDLIKSAAAEHSIPIQSDSRGNATGTDTDAFWSIGVPSATISIALTNMHTQVETIHPDDIDGAIALYVATLSAFKNKANRNFLPIAKH